MFVFFNDTATTEIYTLSLHDALPICRVSRGRRLRLRSCATSPRLVRNMLRVRHGRRPGRRPDGTHLPSLWDSNILSTRSEEHTSELQSRQYLVCRLLLEKKKKHAHHT